MKKLLSVILVMVMTASMLVGCNGGSSKSHNGNKEVIEVKLWRSGNGEEWFKAMKEAFEKEYPEYAIEYTAFADAAAVLTGYGEEDIDTTDLYFAIGRDDECLSLDDLLDSKAEGESKTIREKFVPGMLDLVTQLDGSIRQLTYGGGTIGIVYNKKLFDKAGITELPKTTNELVVVCDTLKSNDIDVWCHFQNGGYWDYMTEVFATQYDGLDYRMNTFWACKDENGNSPSKDVLLEKDGRYEALKMYEAILTPEYVLSGSNSADHITMQTRFIHGQAAMMVNGTWMSNEMSQDASSEDFAVMKTPVISSIVNKLETVKKESQLSALVEAIDAVTDGTKKVEDYKKGDAYMLGDVQVSAADWEYVMNARNTVGTNYSGCTSFIPNYSEQKDGAIEFLRFMYSDEGLKIFAEKTGTMLPLTLDEGEIDTSKWNDFQNSNVELLNTAVQFASYENAGKHPIFPHGGMINNFANKYYVQYLSALNAKDRKTADELWSIITNSIESNYDKVWIPNIK